jgi:hypothetical protein
MEIASNFSDSSLNAGLSGADCAKNVPKRKQTAPNVGRRKGHYSDRGDSRLQGRHAHALPQQQL